MKCQYSDMCVLADGTVLCLYEGGAKHPYESIRQARFNRAWLTRRLNGKDYEEE
jgi:hypothetical protein